MLALIFALAVQSAPPPFLDYIEEASELGRASVMAGACSAMEIVEVDRAKLTELLEDFDRRAIIDRANGPVLNQALRTGAEREKQNLKTMMDLGADDGSERRLRREEQLTEYLGNGCADLAINYPAVFKLPD